MLFSDSRSSRWRGNDGGKAIHNQQSPNVASSSATHLLLRYKSAIEHRAPSQSADGPDLQDLNNALLALAEIFPDVRPDVFREMLGSLSPSTRLHVVADQLLNHGAKWIAGRWRISSKVASSKISSEALNFEVGTPDQSEELVPIKERFRTQEYKTAVKAALTEEFSQVSRTAMDGVLAEQNFSYTDSRPILEGLAARSWRMNFKALLKWKKKTEKHFMLLPAKDPSSGAVYLPQLKQTISPELDEELHQTILQPILDEERRTKDAISQELAILLNNADAKDNNALYECECCFDEVAFEFVAICSAGEHVLCLNCVRNTVSAALYAQAWSKTVDKQRAALFCFSPVAEACPGCISGYLVQRALLQSKGGMKIWTKFEDKLSTDARKDTGRRYQVCPSCSYAEDDDVYWPKHGATYRLRWPTSFSVLFSMVSAVAVFLPLCWIYFWISLLLPLVSPMTLLRTSLKNLARKNCLSLIFNCLNPECRLKSCRLCKAAWRNPHKCNDREEVSLRTTIEAARSAAGKRVCPKCNLSFVKESGCNKMTCNCGYTMCYLCRQGLGQSADKNNPHNDHDYSHFCQHFRAFPGQCSQCNKCDLYREENEEEIIRKAGITAETEWKARKKKQGTSSGIEYQDNSMQGRIQAFVDGVVETFVTC